MRGRVVRVEMEDAASGLEWTQIGVYLPVRGQAKTTVAVSGGTGDTETKDPAQDAWESLNEELDKIYGEYMIGERSTVSSTTLSQFSAPRRSSPPRLSETAG